MADMDIQEMFHNFNIMHLSEGVYHELNIDDPLLYDDPELKGLVGALVGRVLPTWHVG
jgi:hypothetical protein